MAATLALPGLAHANSSTFTNPLVRGVPSSALGFVSIDLGTRSKQLTDLLKIVARSTHSSLGPLAASGLKMLGASDKTVKAVGAQMDSRVVIYATNVDPGALADPGKLMKDLVVLVGLKNGAPVQKSLTGSPSHLANGFHVVELAPGTDARVEGNTLILGQNPANIAGAVKALRGGPRLATRQMAAIAANTIETDAQILAWAPKMATGKAATTRNSVSLTTGPYIGFSIALRPKGFSICGGPMKLSSLADSDFRKLRTLPSDYVRRLPSGAYMVIAIANPWPVLQANHALSPPSGDYAKLLGSLSGDLTIGLYPSQLKQNKAQGLDLLVELHPSEGNAAAHILRSMLAVTQKETLPGDEPVVQKFHLAGATAAYRMNKGLASMMHSTIRSMIDSAKANSLIVGKNLVFATVGKNIIFSSSEATLRRAVRAATTGAGSLAADPQYAELASDARMHRSTVTLAISPTHVIEGVSDLISRVKIPGIQSKDVKQYRQLLAGWPSPLFVRLTVVNQALSARLFIPIDIAQLLKTSGPLGVK